MIPSPAARAYSRTGGSPDYLTDSGIEPAEIRIAGSILKLCPLSGIHSGHLAGREVQEPSFLGGLVTR
jgi:hypothetical protein